MYLCENCATLFDEPKHFKESHGFEHPPFEEWDGCPCCGESGYVTVENCNGCGEIFQQDELYDGFCIGCLCDRLDYQTALDFLEDQKLLFNFFFWAENNGNEPKFCSDSLLKIIRELYKRKVANDLLTNSTDFLEVVKEFIFDAVNGGKSLFAEFVNARNGGAK